MKNGFVKLRRSPLANKFGLERFNKMQKKMVDSSREWIVSWSVGRSVVGLTNIALCILKLGNISFQLVLEQSRRFFNEPSQALYL